MWTYRGADKSLAWPGGNEVIFMSEWREFPSAPYLVGKKILDSSRLDVVEIARVPNMLPSLFPSRSSQGYCQHPSSCSVGPKPFNLFYQKSQYIAANQPLPMVYCSSLCGNISEEIKIRHTIEWNYILVANAVFESLFGRLHEIRTRKFHRSCHRPGVAQSVPGSYGSQISWQRHRMVVRLCQPYHQEISLVVISVRVDPRAVVQSEGFYGNENFQWSNQRPSDL